MKNRFLHSIATAATAFVALAIVVLSTTPALGWGRRGHALVAETAAYLIANDPKANADFLKDRSFDLGYYANVPDLVWKKPATYEIESLNHFMDFEIFEREMKDSKVEKPFEMDRLAFNAAFPKIEPSAGRSWWRIRELTEKLDGATKTLKKSDLSQEARQTAQGEWLVTAGVLAHYVGDLAQPLHVTENYDGQMTNQKGIHAFFEDTMVNELYPDIAAEASKIANKQWKDFAKKNSEKPLLQLLQELTKESNQFIPDLLKIDKKVGRTDLKKAAQAYHSMIVGRLVKGSLVLAEIWRRSTGWNFDGKKYYFFDSTPAYMYPPGSEPTSPAKGK